MSTHEQVITSASLPSRDLLRRRLRAAAIHLAISATVAALVATAMVSFWYPGLYLKAMGGLQLFVLIAAVDVVLGPLVTLVIFDARKPRRTLLTDCALVGAMQFAALVFGVSVMFSARPVHAVFVKLQFNLVGANQIAEQELAQVKDPRFRTLPILGPTVVGSRLPTDAAEQERVLISAIGGLDSEGFPQYYVPFDTVSDQVVRAARPVSDLRAIDPANSAVLQAALNELGRNEARVGFVPVKGPIADLTALVDRDTGALLRFIDTRPW